MFLALGYTGYIIEILKKLQNTLDSLDLRGYHHHINWGTVENIVIKEYTISSYYSKCDSETSSIITKCKIELLTCRILVSK